MLLIYKKRTLGKKNSKKVHMLKATIKIWLYFVHKKKYQIYLSQYVKSMQFLSKYHWQFYKISEDNAKIHLDSEKIQEKLGSRHRLCKFKAYYKAIIIKTAWYWHKTFYLDQWKKNKPKNLIHIIVANWFCKKYSDHTLA